MGHGLRPLRNRYATRHALRAQSMRFAYLSLRDRNPLRFSDGVPAARPYFFATAQKSRQKTPLSSQLSNPLQAPALMSKRRDVTSM